MKRLLPRGLSRLGALGAVLLAVSLNPAFTPPAAAFPPAPPHTVFGLVRNQWGDPINAVGATVFLQTSNSIGVKTSITASQTPGVNYRLAIPMDAGTTSDLYLPTALRRGQAFQLRVLIGNTYYLPIEMTLGSATLGQAGGSTRLDLTLGEDTDRDGLPDAWEQAIISVLGGTLASITANGDADGDGISNLDEYLAGTYAFDPEDGFRVSLVSRDATDSVLEFLAIRGRTYTLQASSNLQQWSPVNFRVMNGQQAGALQSSYPATDVRYLQIRVPHQAGTSNQFFKAVVH